MFSRLNCRCQTHAEGGDRDQNGCPCNVAFHVSPPELFLKPQNELPVRWFPHPSKNSCHPVMSIPRTTSTANRSCLTAFGFRALPYCFLRVTVSGFHPRVAICPYASVPPPRIARLTVALTVAS